MVARSCPAVAPPFRVTGEQPPPSWHRQPQRARTGKDKRPRGSHIWEPKGAIYRPLTDSCVATRLASPF